MLYLIGFIFVILLTVVFWSLRLDRSESKFRDKLESRALSISFITLMLIFGFGILSLFEEKLLVIILTAPLWLSMLITFLHDFMREKDETR